jgi:formamidase
VPPVAFAPLASGAYVGQELDPKVREKIYREGARTVPGREHGGNCDVSSSLCDRAVGFKSFPRLVDQESFQVSCFGTYWLYFMKIDNPYRGSRCYFPVFVKGANLSVGDLHFSQGDVSVFHPFFSQAQC